MIFTLLSFLSATPSAATTNGKPLIGFPPIGPQSFNQCVSDGAGGMIVAWVEARPFGSGDDIYAQRVDAAGEPQWGNSGILVCGAAAPQVSPTIVPDSAGGAIIYWQDHRSGDADIYGQRLNGAGVALWGADGVGVLVGLLDQVEPRAVSGVAGESFVVWRQVFAGVATLWVQKTSAAGVGLWTPGGLPGVSVTGMGVDLRRPDLIHDGAGGVVVAFEADASGDINIHAQRIDTDGFVLWGDDAEPVCVALGNQLHPRISQLGSYAITWEDNRGADSDIYAQRLTPALGAPIWTVNGIPVCAAAGDQFAPVVNGTLAPFTLYVWEDERGADRDIHGQLLAADGDPSLWSSDGVALVSSPGNQSNFSIAVSTGAEAGAFFDLVWEDSGGGSNIDIRGQRFSFSGSPLWAVGGVAIGAMEADQCCPVVVATSAPSLLVAWVDSRGLLATGFAQSVSVGGVVEWAADGSMLTPFDQGPHVTATDGIGGVVDAWVDRRAGAGDVYAQHVDGAMNLTWGTTGSPVCLAVGEQRDPAIATDGAGGAFVAWIDDRAGGPPQIFAQHIAADGLPSWALDGVLVCSAAGGRADVQVVRDGAGGAIIAWSDTRGSDSDIYAQHLDSAGAPILAVDGIALCAAIGDQTSPRMARFIPAQAVVVWEDQRAGNADIYAQRVGLGGVDPTWQVNGSPVCVDPAEQVQPQIVEDQIIVWTDARGSSLDIYADRLGAADGESLWEVNGLAVCAADGDQSNPRLVDADVNASLISLVAWEDSRLGDIDIYAQRLAGTGVGDWTPNGVLVCGAAGDQGRISISAAPSQGALLTWSDGRFTTSGVYAQRLEPEDGAGMWGTDGLLLSDVAGDGAEPIIVEDSGQGGGFVTWLEPRWAGVPIGVISYIAPLGRILLTSVEDATTPGRVRLRQNAPNPFNPSTRIEFAIPEAGRVRLDVYDVRGRFVARLLDEDRPAGSHAVHWRGVRSGAPVASGVYYYRLEALGVRDHRKMVLLK